MRNISRVLRLWCLVLIMVLLAAGCKARPPVTVKKEIGVTLRRPEIMLVVATERNRYEQIYTSQIWDIAVVEDGKAEHVGGDLLPAVKLLQGAAEDEVVRP